MDSSLNRPEETPGNLYRQYKETKRRAYKHISDIRVQLSQETESGEDNLDNNHYQIPDGDTNETADSSRMVIGQMKERMKETTRSEEKKISLQEQRNMKFEAVTSFKETYHSLRYVYSRLYPVLKSYYEYKAKLSDHENPPSLKNLQDMAEGIQKLQKQVQELNSDPVFSAEAREQGLTDFTRGQRQKLEKSINDMKQAKGLLKPGEGSDDSRLSRITAVFRKIQLPKASESKRPLKEMETSLNTIFPPSEDQLVEQAEGLVQDLKRRVLPPLTDTDNPNLGTLASNLETLLRQINRRMSRRKGIWIDYRDHQRNSDIVRNVGTRRPDIANLFIHGKIEIFPDTSITKLIETKEVNRRVHMAIRSDLSIEEATDAIIDVIDDNRYRDLFQGKVEPPMQKTKNLIALYKDAALAHENLSSFIEQFAAQTHGNPMLASLKEREDAFDKILSDYGGDIKRITDIARGAIVYPTMGHINLARGQIDSTLNNFLPNAEIVRVKDFFTHIRDDGYHFIRYNIRMPNGHIAELQFCLAAIEALKAQRREIYGQCRGIERTVRAEEREFSPDERQELEELTNRSQALMRKALTDSLREGGVFERVSRNFLEAIGPLKESTEETRSPKKPDLTFRGSTEEVADHIARCLMEGKGGLVFDFNHTLITPGGKDQMMPKEWIRSAKTLLDNGVTIVIITGDMKDVENAFDNAGSEGRDLKDEIHMLGLHGIEYKGPLTSGEKRLSNKKLEKFIEPAKEVMNEIRKNIDNSKVLNELRSKGVIPEEIQISFAPLGGSVLKHSAIENVRTQVTEKYNQDDTIDIEKTVKEVCQEVENIASKVVDNNQYFRIEHTLGTRIDIRLNPEEIAIISDKEDVVHNLAKIYEWQSLFVFGDAKRDIDVDRRAEQLVALHEFVNHSMSEKEHEFVDRFISEIDQRYQLGLSEEEKQSLAEAKDSLHKGLITTLYDRNKTALQKDDNHALVGVKYPPHVLLEPKRRAEAEKVQEAAITMVDGPPAIVALVEDIADRIVEMKKHQEQPEAS